MISQKERVQVQKGHPPAAEPGLKNGEKKKVMASTKKAFA